MHVKNQNKNFWNKIKRNKLGKGWKQNPRRKNELKFCFTFFTELQKQKFMYKIYRMEMKQKKCSKHKLNAKKKFKEKVKKKKRCKQKIRIKNFWNN